MGAEVDTHMSELSKVLVIGSRPIIIGQVAGSIHPVDDLADAFRFIEEAGKSWIQEIDKAGRLEQMLQPSSESGCSHLTLGIFYLMP